MKLSRQAGIRATASQRIGRVNDAGWNRCLRALDAARKRPAARKGNVAEGGTKVQRAKCPYTDRLADAADLAIEESPLSPRAGQTVCLRPARRTCHTLRCAAP